MQIKRFNTIKILEKYWPYLVILSSIVVFFINRDFTPQADWLYFNSLAHFSWPIQNGEISYSDLNICGGVDNFANPQMWYFSPTNIIYLFTGPHWGNILSWYLYCAIGFFYFYLICKEIGTKLFVSQAISLLFVLSSFFSLHFIEGHIVFRTFFLIPTIYYYAYKNLSARKLSILLIILTFMVMDGGMYPFFFSIIMLAFVLDYKTFEKKILINKLFFTILFSCFLIGLAKAIPVLSMHGSRPMIDDPETYSIVSFFKALYYPFFINWDTLGTMKYRVHEYALYFGIGLTSLVAFNIKSALRMKELYYSVFFLWIATGFGGDINPWTLIKMIPYLQQIHVQSRFLVLFLFFILISIIKTKKLHTKRNLILLSIALLESSIVYFFIMGSSFIKKEPRDSYMFLTTKKNLELYDVYITKPAVYGMNRISHGCYEPAANKKIIPARNLFLNTTEGVSPMLDIKKDSVVIKLKKELEKPLVVNLHWNAGWTCENCDIDYNDGIIQINTLGKKEYKLKYTPFYFPFILLTWIVGVMVGCYGWRKYKDF